MLFRSFWRRAHSYFTFRERDVEFSWVGQSDRPSNAVIDEVAAVLLNRRLMKHMSRARQNDSYSDTRRVL